MLFVCFTIWSGLAQEYKVKIKINNEENCTKVKLAYADMQKITDIKPGGVEFIGTVTEPGIATIEFYSAGDEDNSTNFYFFLCPGTTNIVVQDLKQNAELKVSGPKWAEDYQNKLLMPITAMNVLAEEYRRKYKEAKKENLPDTLTYTNLRNKAIFDCYQFPQNYIKTNPSSPLNFTALQMMGMGSPVAKVDVEMLRRIFDSLSQEVRASKAGQEYEKRLERHSRK